MLNQLPRSRLTIGCGNIAMWPFALKTCASLFASELMLNGEIRPKVRYVRRRETVPAVPIDLLETARDTTPGISKPRI